MRKLNLLLAALCMTVAPALAKSGNEGGGGGDLCENRVQNIRDDISSWISRGGHTGLSLSISKDQYANAMSQAIGIAKIRCVSPGDAGYPVQVDGTPKECRFDTKGGKALITCDRSKFESRSESDQYVLVHHEFAGIAGVENPSGDISSYRISQQLTSYLVDVTMKKLAVKQVNGPASVLNDLIGWTPVADRLAVEQAIKIAHEQASWTDCKVELGVTDNGIPFASYTKLNSKENLTMPLQLFKTQENTQTGLYEHQQNANVLKEFIESYLVAPEPGEGKMRLAVELIMEFDAPQTKLLRIHANKQEIQTYNAGTITKPVWRERLALRNSVTCNAK